MTVLHGYNERRSFNFQDEELEICDSAEEDNNDHIMPEEENVEMQENDVDTDGYSEYSEESEEEVDPAVQDDMDKFQATFRGIKGRFRLINRIGEGEFLLHMPLPHSYSNI
jgi:cell division control protein 7